MSYSTLAADRAAAVARYSAAMAEARDSAIDLAALDGVLFSSRFGRAHASTTCFRDGLGPANFDWSWVHGEANPWVPSWHATTEALMATYNRQY